MLTTNAMNPLLTAILASALATLNLSACSHTPELPVRPANTCPKTDLGETAADCPWAYIAREWQLTGSDGLTIERMRKDSTELFGKIDLDIKNPAWRELWGRSLNYDELAKETIVDPSLVDRLTAHLVTAPRNERVVHAGIEHTYGYLFSTLQTPYGYKRARWVKPDLEDGLGIPRGSLGPLPTRGTLLSNLSYVIGRIALWNDSAEQKLALRKLEGIVDPALIRFPWKSLKVTRLEERFENHGGDPSERTAAIITLRTDLVNLPRVDATKNPSGNTHLLIYSIEDPRQTPSHRLITAFPVNQAFVDRTLDAGKNKPDESIVVRYNAFLARDSITESTTQTVPGIGTKRVFTRTLR
jgi:hypothetical protein